MEMKESGFCPPVIPYKRDTPQPIQDIGQPPQEIPSRKRKLITQNSKPKKKRVRIRRKVKLKPNSGDGEKFQQELREATAEMLYTFFSSRVDFTAEVKIRGSLEVDIDSSGPTTIKLGLNVNKTRDGSVSPVHKNLNTGLSENQRSDPLRQGSSEHSTSDNKTLATSTNKPSQTQYTCSILKTHHAGRLGNENHDVITTSQAEDTNSVCTNIAKIQNFIPDCEVSPSEGAGRTPPLEGSVPAPPLEGANITHSSSTPDCDLTCDEVEDDELDYEPLPPNSELSAETLQPGEKGLTSDNLKPGERGLTSDNLKPGEEGLTSDNLKPGEEGLTSDDLKPGEEGLTSDDLKPGEEGLTSENLKPGENGLTLENIKLKELNQILNETYLPDVNLSENECDLAVDLDFNSDNSYGFEHLEIINRDHDYGASYYNLELLRMRKLGLISMACKMSTHLRTFYCVLCEDAGGWSEEFKASDICRHWYLQHSKEQRHGKRPFECGLCDVTLSTFNRYVIHRAEKHGGKRPFYQCEFCERRVKDYPRMVAHRLTHTNPRRLTCRYCGVVMTTLIELKVHVVRHTEPARYTCDVCGDVMWKKFSHTVHMMKHRGEEPFLCEICSERFTHRSFYNKHVADKHSGHVLCSTCGKQYLGAAALKSHQKHVHQRDTCYACKFCALEFTYFKLCKSHMKVCEKRPPRQHMKVCEKRPPRQHMKVCEKRPPRQKRPARNKSGKSGRKSPSGKVGADLTNPGRKPGTVSEEREYGEVHSGPPSPDVVPRTSSSVPAASEILPGPAVKRPTKSRGKSSVKTPGKSQAISGVEGPVTPGVTTVRVPGAKPSLTFTVTGPGVTPSLPREVHGNVPQDFRTELLGEIMQSMPEDVQEKLPGQILNQEKFPLKKVLHGDVGPPESGETQNALYFLGNAL